MRWLATVSVAVLALGTFSSARGALLWYDGFDYTAGTPVADHGAWKTSDAGQGSGTTIIDAVGLTYPGLSTSGGSGTMTGNSNTPVNTSDSAGGPDAVNWNSDGAGVFYMSLLMKGNNMDLWHNPFGQGSIIRHRSDNATIDTPDVGGDEGQNGQPTFDDDKADLLLLRITAPSGGDSGKQEMIVNPTLPITDEAAAFTGAAVINNWPDGGSDRFFQFSRSPNGGDVSFDEIRIATTLSEALPEPTSMTLIGIGCLVLLMLRKKR